MEHRNQAGGKVPRLAVTGATGELGGRVAARLSKLGVAQRLVVRDPKRAPQLPGAKRIGPYNCTAHVAEKEYFLAIWNRLETSMIRIGPCNSSGELKNNSKILPQLNRRSKGGE